MTRGNPRQTDLKVDYSPSGTILVLRATTMLICLLD